MILDSGISKVVLYSHTESGKRYGVPWDGVTSIHNERGQSKTTGVYYDAQKIDQHVEASEYKGKISAYSYPTEFYPHDGFGEAVSGMYLDEQYPSRFSLVYRTEIGDRGAYKLHILYNLLAHPESTSHATLSQEPSPILNSWSLTGVPETIQKYRPTGHVIVDSRLLKPSALYGLESLLYGSEEDVPELPDLQYVIDNVLYQTFVLTDITTDTWTLLGPDHLIETDDDGIFTIDGIKVIFHDDDTYTLIDDYEG